MFYKNFPNMEMSLLISKYVTFALHFTANSPCI